MVREPVAGSCFDHVGLGRIQERVTLEGLVEAELSFLPLTLGHEYQA